MAKAIGDNDFKTEVLDFDGVVVVDFWAPWCGPCRIQGPIIDSLSEKYKDDASIKFTKLDVDENPETGRNYSIMSIPTLLMFKNGEMVESLIGLRNEDELDQKVNALK